MTINKTAGEICAEWGMTPAEADKVVAGPNEAAMIIGIALGLDMLFGDDLEAEREWMRRVRSRLGGRTPVDHILLDGLPGIMDVNDLLNEARNV